MAGLTCNSCNKVFSNDTEQKEHYKSEWHRYNLKRKIAGVPGVTERLFLAKQSLAEEKNNQNDTPMLYSCGICGKGYRSAKAHAQHLNSKSHLVRASHGENQQNESNTIIKPLTRRLPVKPPQEVVKPEDSDENESDDEWEEVDPDEDLLGEATSSLSKMDVNGHIVETDGEGSDEDDEMMEDLDPSSCFMCDLKHDTIENCMVHMHKKHGFFIPDVEYLKDPNGFLTYLGLKVKRDFMCLYCNERCQPFSSLEAVRKHMEAKSHCKVPYGDGGDDEEVELEEFYDYSSSYIIEDGKQLIVGNDMDNSVELGSGEIIIKRRTNNGMSTKSIGSREFLRYYKQRPKPSPANEPAVNAVNVALASRYRSMGLTTVQSREQIVRMKVMKQMNRSGAEAMRTRIGLKNNVIFNLPKNVPY